MIRLLRTADAVARRGRGGARPAARGDRPRRRRAGRRDRRRGAAARRCGAARLHQALRRGGAARRGAPGLRGRVGGRDGRARGSRRPSPRRRAGSRRSTATSCPRSWWVRDEHGSLLGQQVTPLDRVGCYVPGGTAAYPSTVLMNLIPARVAGVRELVVVSPPGGDGRVPAAVLAAARLAGATEVYRMGGAQAVAALAYGTATVPAVDKIVGPGNLYVALAKRLVFGDVGIDLVAGPSEVVVVADRTAEAAHVAADLLAQAEHDPMARAVCLTDDAALGARVVAAVGAPVPGPAAGGHRGGRHPEPRRRGGDAGPRRGAGDRQPPGAGASRARGRRSLRLAPGGPARRGDLPRRAHARGGGRLPGRPEPRPAHRGDGALRVGPVGGGFHQALEPHPLHAGRAPGGVAPPRRAGGGGGAPRARARRRGSAWKAPGREETTRHGTTTAAIRTWTETGERGGQRGVPGGRRSRGRSEPVAGRQRRRARGRPRGADRAADAGDRDPAPAERRRPRAR